jgi:phosphoenolpyruvate carboxykinase (GTP)
MRVLKWMFERIDGVAHAQETTLGFQPEYSDLDWSGLQFSEETFNKLSSIENNKWLSEFSLHKEFFLTFKDTVPAEFVNIQEQKWTEFKKLSEASTQ